MNRLGYIDALRGIGIILLVYNHFLFFGFSGGMSTMTPLDNEVMFILMPLFFVISGFVSYRKEQATTLPQLMKTLWMKVRQLLIPTIIMFVFSRYAHCASIVDGLQDIMKKGYWFTFTLFQIIVIYQILIYIARHFSKHIYKILVLCLPALIFAFPPEYTSDNQYVILKILSIRQLLAYYQYFIVGVIAKYNFELLQKTMTNKWWISLCFIYAFFCPTYHDPYTNWLIIIARITCIFWIAYYYRNWLDKDSFLPNQLRYIGRHTIEIYFLHYFFLFKIPTIEMYLFSFINAQDTICLAHEYMLELLIVGTLAIIVCYVCLLIRKILDAFPLISELCFGPNK